MKNKLFNMGLKIIVSIVCVMMLISINFQAIPIEDTESMDGELIFNNTYFLTTPVNIMKANEQDIIPNHQVNVFNDKVCWIQYDETNSSRNVVVYNITNQSYDYYHSSVESNGLFGGYISPTVSDDYMMTREESISGFGADVFDLDGQVFEGNTGIIFKTQSSTSIPDNEDNAFVYIEYDDNTGISDINLINSTELEYYLLPPVFINETGYSILDYPVIDGTEIMVIGWNNNTDECSILSYNITTNEYNSIYTDNITEYTYMTSFNNNNICIQNYNTTANIVLINATTKEIIYETNYSVNETGYSECAYPMYHNGKFITYLYVLYDVETTIVTASLNLVNFETGEEYILKWCNDTVMDNYQYTSSLSFSRHNIYQYPNGTYIIVDDNPDDPLTLEYDSTIMISYLIPITEIESTNETDAQTLSDVIMDLLPVLLSVLILLIIIRFFMGMMIGKKRK